MLSAAERFLANVEFDPARPVIAAVSGGGDSLALLILLHSHLRRHHPGTRLLAVTVDHGLRPGSAAEARAVGEICHRLDLDHEVRNWTGDKPKTGLMAAAREARVRLLLEAAHDVGAQMIVTGHTLDDQAETVLMRRARRSGRGLAGIAPATLLGGRTWLLRPLLGERRKTLRGYLSREGLSWTDDPSNENTDFERVRARREMASGGANLFEELIREGNEAARRRTDEGRRAAALIGNYACMASPGLLRLASELPDDPDCEAAVLALRALIAVVGGREQLPDEARVADLRTRLATGPLRATLAGTVIDNRKAGIFLRRELRSGWTSAAPARPGLLWDGRFRVVGSVPRGARVAAAGHERATSRAEPSPDVPASLQRLAMAAEPVLAQPSGGGEIEASAEVLRRVPAPWARYLPSFDFVLAEAVAVLLDAERFPPPPLRGHNAAYSP